MKRSVINRFTADKVAYLKQEFGNHVLSFLRRNQLNNIDFSIISNNCWGGYVYRRYGLEYSSPTVGLYFYADDYIRFISNLRHYLSIPIKVENAKTSKYYHDLTYKGEGNIPVGHLEDIEVMFLHYKTLEEAETKWTRRCERVNYDNLIIKMSEQNQCNEEHLSFFQRLDLPAKKILLTSVAYDGIDSVVVDKYSVPGNIINDTIYYDNFFCLEEFINK